MPVTGTLPSRVPCADCQIEPQPFTAAIAPLHYSFPVDEGIKALKFHRKLQYQPAFSDILLREISRLPPNIDALLPVPLHRWRNLRRGFNQAAELARPLQKQLDAVLIDSVKRVKRTPYQSGLHSADRRRNLNGAFRVRDDFRARHVLIIDDVITTGETCRQLARVLIQNGAEQVSVLALARASKDHFS
jgi:ComF family protein